MNFKTRQTESTAIPLQAGKLVFSADSSRGYRNVSQCTAPFGFQGSMKKWQQKYKMTPKSQRDERLFQQHDSNEHY